VPIRFLARTPILAALLTLAAAFPLAAQASLGVRMRAFLAEIENEPNTALAAFFPRRGDWTWIQTQEDLGGGPDVLGVWRFPAAETVRAIANDGPACSSFDHARGEFGPYEGSLGMQMMMYPGPWRRVRGTRFVPPGRPDSYPVFVEWRREDGEWVVSAFGEMGIVARSIPRLAPGPFSRDTAGVPEDSAYVTGRPVTITIEGWRFTPFRDSRAVDRTELVRIGHLHGVSVYVGRGSDRRDPEIVYLPVGPGRYLPYEGPRPQPCA
jgi:hypothetical protein